MEPACTPWIRSLTAGVVLAALAGCSALAPPPSPAPLLHDALFDHPARPAEADAAMAVDDAMRHYVRGVLAGAARDRGRPRALADALYAPGQLKLEYDAAVTRTAAQAFAARSGNCLSLVLMTAALAREMGLDVVFQSSRWVETYSRSGDLTFYNGHVNLVLARAALPAYRDAGHHTRAADALQIDFLPPEALGGLRSVPISEQRVRAMFMNNRAVETLPAGRLLRLGVDPPGRLPGQTRFACAVGEGNEVRSVVRACLASGTPLDEVEVLVLGHGQRREDQRLRACA